MESTKVIKLIGKALNVKKNTSTVMQSFKIDNGKITLSNGATLVTIKTDEKGQSLIDFERFEKTENVTTSVSYQDIAEFKDDIIAKAEYETIKEETLDPAIFQKSYSEYFKFVAEDKTRAILTEVCINEKYAVATDGHHGICDTSIKSEVPVCINAELSKVMDIILKQEPIVLAKKISVFRKEEYNHEVSKGTDEYLHLESRTYAVTSKMKEGTVYPKYECCVPAKNKQVLLSFKKEEIALLREALKKIMPYSHEKTHLVTFYRNVISLVNRNMAAMVKVTLPFIISPEVPVYGVVWVDGKQVDVFKGNKDLYIGFNAEYLVELLSLIECDCEIGFKTTISAVTFYPEHGPELLQMPLRIIEDDEGISQKPEKLGDYTELGCPEIKTTSKKVEPKSAYYLFSLQSLFGITTNKEMPGIVRQLSETEYKALAKLGVNMVTEMETAEELI